MTRIVQASFIALLLLSLPTTLLVQLPSVAQASSLSDGQKILKSGDASALEGMWKGKYTLQSGFSGRTQLTLTSTGPDTVDAVFEYFWRGGNYHRFPDSGEHPGRITSTGILQFGNGSNAWELTIERDGKKLRFRAKERVAGEPAKLDWKRKSGPLPSEN